MNILFSATAEKQAAKAPDAVIDDLEKAIDLFSDNPRHPSLRLKKVGKLWSIRLACGWRVLMRESAAGYEVLYVVDHDEYERLIRAWH